MQNVIYLTTDYVALCLLLLLTIILCKAVYNITLHPLRSYPGPIHWAASRFPWAYTMQSGRLHQRLHELHTRYGPIVRIAPDELSYIESQAWYDIYQPRAGHSALPKNNIWAKQPPGAPHSIMSTDEAAHARNRRALMGSFTEHAVQEHASVIDEHLNLLMQQFRTRAAASGGTCTVNMVDWLNYLTFDISGALSFGTSFDSVKNGSAHPWVEISCTFGKGLALMASINFFAPLDRLLAATIPAKVRRKMVYHRELVHERLAQRIAMSEKDGSQDYVGSVLQYNEAKGEVRVPREELEANMSVLIFAGSETTATALVATIDALVAHPAELTKLVEEVRGSFVSVEEIDMGSVSRLDYLTAVIKEGIRLGPPAAVGLPRVVPKPGETICGQWVPGGTFVSLNQYPAYRSTENFSQPDSFIPARFTDETPFPADNISVFQPFLVGTHMCLGHRLAWAEMRLLLARLLWEFDLAGVAGKEYGSFGNHDTYLFWDKGNLDVQLKPKEISEL